jgi:hypothetical protein
MAHHEGNVLDGCRIGHRLSPKPLARSEMAFALDPEG